MKSQILSCVVLLALLSEADAVTFNVTKIADTATPIPNGTGTFTSIPNFSLDQGKIAFKGVGPGQDGVYLYTGGILTRVADTATPIPDGVGNFTVFSDVSLDGLDLAFYGGADGQAGIYTNFGGSLSKLVDRNTPIPDGTGTFEIFGQPSLDGDAVAFVGARGANQLGVYLFEGGALSTVADTNTPIPGRTGNFIVVSSTTASLDGGQVAFTGYGSDDALGYSGIYVSEGGIITKVADLNTSVPDGVGTFPRFQQPVIDDGIVAFQSYDALNEPGIFLADEGTITRINSDVGGGLSIPSLNAGSVAFEAFVGTDSHGIYTTLDGMLSKVIDVGDTLDGKTFNPNSTISFSVGEDGISGNQIAFRAVFADGSQGLFLATLVPEPSSIALIGLAILALIGCGFHCGRICRTS